MTVRCELPLTFDCEGDRLYGIVAVPPQPVSDVGVVIAVGGPQYRAGSHRQFTLLARSLADAGVPALRFDVRGMGDSHGEFPGFEALGPDLRAAARAMRDAQPGVRRIVFWGLCDAASAILMNLDTLPAVAGAVLLNPWVRHVDSHAKVQIKHYYAQRILTPAFWRKLLSGRVAVGASLGELGAKVLRVARASGRAKASTGDYRDRMLRGALGFAGPQLFVLSGRDHVCAEFIEHVAAAEWRSALWQRPQVQRLALPEADHTFSSAALRQQVERVTLELVRSVAVQPLQVDAHPAVV